MKNLLLTVVAFSVLLLIGCQENSITDPVQDIGLQKSDDPLLQQGTIALEDLLINPSGPFNNYVTLNGSIEYVHWIDIVDPAPPAPQYYVYVGLSVNAQVSDANSSNGQTWRISTDTEDEFYISEEGIYLLEKTFPIQGREDGMVLKCRFLVTTDGLGLNEMWLDFTDGNVSLNNSTNEIKTVTLPPVERVYND